MLKIDLDQVFALLNPTHAVVRLDGTDYRMRRLAVLDVARLGAFADHDDASNAAWLATLFDGDAPAFLAELQQPNVDAARRGELIHRSMVLMQAIFLADDELTRLADPSKKAERAAAAIKAQISPSTPASTSSD